TKRILRYVLPYRPVVFGALFLSLLVALTSQSFPRLQAYAIDHFLLPAPGSADAALGVDARLAGLTTIAVIYLGVALLEFCVRYGFQYTLTWLGQHVLFDIRADIFSKLQRLPLAYFDKNPVGRLITRVTSDVDAINQFITNGLVTLAQSTFILLAVLGFMFTLNWRLALITLTVTPFLFLASRFFQVRMRGAYRETRIRQAIVNTSLNENITGMGTVQLFNREERNRKNFDHLNRDFLNANLNSVRWFSMFFPVVGFIGNAALAAVLWYGGGQTLQNALTIGALFAFTQYARSFFQPLQDLSDVFNTLQAAMASAERIFGVMDEPEVVSDGPDARRISGFRGEVEFRDVWFSYAPPEQEPQAGEWVLRGINFHVRPGESVAFVGATGAGKTSVISLVSRFYDVQKGQVLVDGMDVRSYAQRDLRKHVGVVLQDVFLFMGTIESNLRMNDDSIPHERVVQACKYVGVHDFIMSLPQGYQTEVRERGATLSTGQKQLLAFARALIQNPDIVLVLDEATANVDTETEMQLQDAQAKLMHGRTSLIIAHRLSTIKHCDRIIVMRKGKIVEEGTHDVLLARNGYYANLYRLQYADQELVS
ncbi:MAG TPA: ABC transporter ATP-binding protein, partial [Deinococcales bacterium]|nr:ABC transporter ATP-binding protein [Deinococcales bacterium]